MQTEQQPPEKQNKLRSALKKTYERLLKIRGEPREIALGFALGIFVGMSPFMGFQIAIAVFFATLFKWNKISSAIGVWISNPLSAPFIYSITYFLGAKILGIRKAATLSDNLDSTSVFQLLSKTPEIIWAMVIGGIVLGIPLAISAYYFSYSAVRKYQDEFKAKLAKQKEKMALRREEKKKRKKQKGKKQLKKV